MTISRWMLVTACGLTPGLALADGPTGTDEARGLFAEVVRAYQSTANYRDHGRFEIVAKLGDTSKTITWPAAITLARPNKIAVDAGDLTLAGDGKSIATAIGPTKKYLVGPSPAAIRSPHLTEGPLGASLLGGPVAGPARVLLALLFDEDPAATIFKDVTAIRREEDADSRRILVLETNSGHALRLRIDPATKLLDAIELVVTPEALKARAPEGSGLADATVAWRSGEISTEPIGDDAFVFKAPEGFVKLEAVQIPPERREPAGKP